MIVKFEVQNGFQFITAKEVKTDLDPDPEEPIVLSGTRTCVINNEEYRHIYVTTESDGIILIRTNGRAFLLNNEGKTIDRI